MLVVVGAGAASIVPETAALSVGPEATADSPGAALARVARASDAVLAAARAHGIAEADVRTRAVGVNQRIDMHGRPISGYVAVHELGLRMSSVAGAPSVIDAVAEAAGDTLRLGGFALSSPDLTAARAEAAADAVADARSRGAVLARAAGVRLGPVLSIVEDPGAGYERYPQAVDMSFGRRGAHMPIQAGTDTVMARFTVTFRIGRDPTA